MQSQPAAAALQVAVDGLEPTYSVLRSPLLPHVADQDAGAGAGPVLLPCRLWGNSDRDGDVSEAGLVCHTLNQYVLSFSAQLRMLVWFTVCHRRDVCANSLVVWHQHLCVLAHHNHA